MHGMQVSQCNVPYYCKVPKFSDTRNFFGNLPKIQTKRQKLRVFCLKDLE